MRRRRWLLIALSVACGPLAQGGPPSVPYNTCPCDGYQEPPPQQLPTCTGGICVSPASIDASKTILVVSAPETSFFAQSTTFALSFSRVVPCSTGSCVQLPGVAITSGIYLAKRDDAVHVNWNLQNTGDTALPVRVIYRPLWQANPADPSTRHDANVLGLPLLATAAIISGVNLDPKSGITGPAGGGIESFNIALPPGLYERTVAPEPPFDQAFPPDVSVLQLASGQAPLEEDYLTLDTTPRQTPSDGGSQVEYPTFQVSRQGGSSLEGSSLQGWTLELRDATTKRVNSSVVVLSGTEPQPLSVQLNTNHHPPQPNGSSQPDALYNEEVVLAPPAADAIPIYVVGRQANVLPLTLIYPAIDPPSVVQGEVTDPDHVPIAADVTFKSTKLYTSGATTGPPNLQYATQVTAHDGFYEVALPRGEYDVIVTPRKDGLAKVLEPKFTVDLSTQNGNDLPVPWQHLVAGTCVVADGRPLSGAEVEASPSYLLRVGDGAGNGAVSSDGWPRQVRTMTDLAGRFTLQVDPGTYDITVRPALATALPWIVSPARPLGASDMALDTLRVPAPIVAGLTILDASTPPNPVKQALVSVFTFPGTGTAAIEIGSAMTDDNGQYDMFLAGALQ